MFTLEFQFLHYFYRKSAEAYMVRLFLQMIDVHVVVRVVWLIADGCRYGSFGENYESLQ